MLTSVLHSVPTPPNGWVCVVCRQGGDASDLVTHTGGKVKCIFHRACYRGSETALIGRCQECKIPLYFGRVGYSASDRDDC